jgi:hypothetical protein
MPVLEGKRMIMFIALKEKKSLIKKVLKLKYSTFDFKTLNYD